MKEWERFGELFFNWSHTFSWCLLHFVNRRVCTTNSLNTLLSQKITMFTFYWYALHFPWMHIPVVVQLELTLSILSWCEFFGLRWSLDHLGLTLVLTIPGNRWPAQRGCHEAWVSAEFSLKDLYLSLDVNECVTNTHRCNLHAECLNTEGSFKCKCKQGYRGSGFDCAGEYHWMSGIVLYFFSPIIDG